MNARAWFLAVSGEAMLLLSVVQTQWASGVPLAAASAVCAGGAYALVRRDRAEASR